MPSVSAVTVTWGSEAVVSGLLDSIAADGTVSETVVVDNRSTDGTAGVVRERYPWAKLLVSPANLGFARAANRGIAASSGEYVLVVNPDVSFGPGFISKLAGALDADPKAGSAAPKLVRTDGRMDSAGLVMKKWRKAVDRGRDLPDDGRWDAPGRVFGPTGAAALYRRAALEDSLVAGEYFDGSFFAYKEDVDLAWRMDLLGWRCLYVPGAVGVHGRGWKGSSRGAVPRFVRRHSFKNHYLTILKNDDLVNMLVHLPWVLGYDLALTLYALLSEPFLFGAYRDIIRLMPEMAEKREQVMARRRVDPAGMRRLFG